VFWPDVVISVPKNACMFHEFHLAGPLIELGRRLAAEALDASEASRGKNGHVVRHIKAHD
jgi:NTE family protein